MSKPIDSKCIQEVSKILGDYTTGSKITTLLQTLHFYDIDTLSAAPQLSTKWKRIDHSSNYECKKSNSAKPFFNIIQEIASPINFHSDPNIWIELRKKINSVLIYYGFEISDLGKIIKTVDVQSFSEAQKRLTSFQEKIQLYEIHPEILNYCTVELFNDNYYHAVFEASKGLLERVRNLSETNLDGNMLINQSFISKSPLILIKGNFLESQDEKSEYNGLKSLLNTIVYLYRNPPAHTPKLFNESSESEAITAFSLMSLAHRILDNCVNLRDFKKS